MTSKPDENISSEPALAVSEESLVPAPERSARAPRPGTFYAIVLIVFLADQASKWWIQTHLFWQQSRPIFGSAFMLTLEQNHGGAWGVLPTSNTLFIWLAVLEIAALLIAYHRLNQLDLSVGSAFALAMGGAFGNLLDRIRFGFVVDFFDARIIHWPVFNIADSAISLGIVLMLFHFLFYGRHEKETDSSAAPRSAAG